MKYLPQPLSRFPSASSAISARSSHAQVCGTRLRSTIDFQPLSFHQLMNRFFSNSPVLNNFCVAPCCFQISSLNQYLNPARFQSTPAKAAPPRGGSLRTYAYTNTPLLPNGASSLRSSPPTPIRYLCPECVIRARMSRRLSATVAPRYSARSAAVHLPIVALMAEAHLSMPSALG
jgi:hypothetical protein